MFAYGNVNRYDPTLVDLTSNFFVLYTNLKVYIFIHGGWSLKLHEIIHEENS